MKLEVGMYVRTRSGIAKIIPDGEIKIISKEKTSYYVDKNGRKMPTSFSEYIFDIDVIKASHNIIDLIEVGDYVNGCRVHRIANCITIILDNEENISWVKPSDIKSIVTKEQFESMSYKAGD